MPAMLAITIKDLRLLFRVKSGLFFALAWPLVISILFGTIYSGTSDGGQRRMAVALADDDQSAGTKTFAAQIVASPHFLGAGLRAHRSHRSGAQRAAGRGVDSTQKVSGKPASSCSMAARPRWRCRSTPATRPRRR